MLNDISDWPAPSRGTSYYFLIPTLENYLARLKWKDTGKYLSSQKSALLAFVALGLVLIITGAVKIGAIVWQIPVKLTQVSTSMYDIIAALFVPLLVIHIILTLAVSSHRKLLISWFTGTISVKASPPSEPDKG
jgi:cytochrome b subunit of formate dehydrogenase